MADEQIDVAIIGGGVAGLYCAWRLKCAHPGRIVVVFEGSARTGGRLLSVRPPDIPTMVAELGGMRILPQVQPWIAQLLQVLNQELPVTDQIELYDFPVDEPQNGAYLRGVFLRLADFTAAPQSPPLLEIQELIASVTPRPPFKLFNDLRQPLVAGRRLYSTRRHLCSSRSPLEKPP
jgi:uncharacterized protein with NAD-binding domain and iron-sulfur cluster